LLGTSLSFNGETFTFSPPGPNSAVTSKVVPLTPAGKYTTLTLLNSIVLLGQGNPGIPIFTLLHGWYGGDAGDLPNPAQPLVYLPQALQTSNITLEEQESYLEIYGPTCRSCHVANGVQAIWSGSSPSEFDPQQHGDLYRIFSQSGICNPGPSVPPAGPALIMPNAKTSFDRLWSTHVGPTANQPNGTGDDITESLQPYFRQMNPNATCNPPSFPNPLPSLSH
jgi:hypothetical protein